MRLELLTESTASRHRTMPARDWSVRRVFYQELLSDQHTPHEATREKQTHAEESNVYFRFLATEMIAYVAYDIQRTDDTMFNKKISF